MRNASLQSEAGPSCEIKACDTPFNHVEPQPTASQLKRRLDQTDELFQSDLQLRRLQMEGQELQNKYLRLKISRLENVTEKSPHSDAL